MFELNHIRWFLDINSPLFDELHNLTSRGVGKRSPMRRNGRISFHQVVFLFDVDGIPLQFDIHCSIGVVHVDELVWEHFTDRLSVFFADLESVFLLLEEVL